MNPSACPDCRPVTAALTAQELAAYAAFRLRLLMRSTGVSQATLARKCNVPRQTIHGLLRCEDETRRASLPSFYLIVKVSRAMGVPLDFFAP